jgi:hypothetical protein
MDNLGLANIRKQSIIRSHKREGFTANCAENLLLMTVHFSNITETSIIKYARIARKFSLPKLHLKSISAAADIKTERQSLQGYKA